MRILIAEDHPDNRDMLARRLLRRGFAVLLAEDGGAAVEIALRERPDLILMDIGMPVLSGIDAARRLKADPSVAAIPIIALTAHAMEVAREEALEAGCVAFATKPVDFAALLALIAVHGPSLAAPAERGA